MIPSLERAPKRWRGALPPPGPCWSETSPLLTCQNQLQDGSHKIWLLSDVLDFFVVANICQLIMEGEVTMFPQNCLSLHIDVIFPLCCPLGWPWHPSPGGAPFSCSLPSLTVFSAVFLLSTHPLLSKEVQVPVRPPSDTLKGNHARELGTQFSSSCFLSPPKDGALHSWFDRHLAGTGVGRRGGKGILPVCWENCCALWMKEFFFQSLLVSIWCLLKGILENML